MDHTPEQDLYDDRLLRVTPTLVIPRAELQFRTSCSGGPGGQHVNKVETKVELIFYLANTPSVSEAQRALLTSELSSWLDSDGTLHIVSERYRSQFKNREDAIERFLALLRDVLRPRKTRRPTRISRAVKEERLQQKKRRSTIKKLRSRPCAGEE